MLTTKINLYKYEYMCKKVSTSDSKGVGSITSGLLWMKNIKEITSDWKEFDSYELSKLAM